MHKDQKQISQVARYTWSATEVKQVKEQLAEGQVLPYVNWQWQILPYVSYALLLFQACGSLTVRLVVVELFSTVRGFFIFLDCWT